jgi:exopolysaccharide biosynthesis polyprenyl glycosylphosphotransferase
MISDRGKGIHHLTLIGQCLLVTASFWGWFLLCQLGSPIIGEAVERYLLYNQFILLGLVIGSTFSRVGAGITSPNFEIASQRAARQLGTMLFYWLLCLVALKDTSVSRAFLFSYIPVAYVLLVATSRYLPPVLGRCIFRHDSRERALLLGPSRKVEKVRRWLEDNPHLGLDVVATLPASERAEGQAAEPTATALARLETTIAKHRVTKLILAEFPLAEVPVRDYADLCERNTVRLLTVTDVDERFGRSVALFEEGGLCFIGLRQEPLEDPLNRFLKRGLDIGISLVVVVFLLPICCVVVWCLQRLQSPGPLFFRQNRPGYYNRHFQILKFRTMHCGNPDENRLATAADPRVFTAGKWLRKSSVDELPQFWNVLCGDMSVVGPRPHLIAHNELFLRFNNKAYVRYFVKPGITGLAQVQGMRGQMDSPEEVVRRVEADIRYLETWSIWKDCALILRTVRQVVLPHAKAI